MATESIGIFGEEHTSTSLKEQLSKYLAKWPLFVASLLVCVAVGILYIRHTVPKYITSTSFLIKGNESSDAGGSDLIEEALNGKSQVNINNVMLLMGSAELMQRTVEKNGFNVSYRIKGRLVNTDVYNEAPFVLAAQNILDSNATYDIYMKKITPVGGTYCYGPGKDEKTYFFRWREPFIFKGQTFVFLPKQRIENGNAEYIARWQPIHAAAADLSANLIIKALDTRTSVVQLSLRTENLKKGKDILNALFTEFFLSDIEDRNKLSKSTVQFIDDRLVTISNELKGVEGNLESYKGQNEIVEIKSQLSQSLSNSDAASKAEKDLAIQQSVAAMILNYFNNPSSSGKLVPSSLGLSDATLSNLIEKFNELQLKKEREAPLVASGSTVMTDLNTQLASLRGSILETIKNISKTLQLQKISFRNQNTQYRNQLAAVPRKERVLQEIQRKQGITEGLYLYLLQKREEAAISSTGSSVPHYKQIDQATGFGPVEPNQTNIILCAVLLGLFLPFAGIYLREMFNDKVTSRRDIQKHVRLPVLGEINHLHKRNQDVIPVLGRTLAGEQFRLIRTNLSFLLKSTDEKVIMVTSSASGEGKSFISLNLAVVFAIPGKRVALLEFDIRRPVIARRLNIVDGKGLTSYLTGETDNLSDIAHKIEEVPTLHIFPCGTLPVNAADLILSKNMAKFFKVLTEAYDYIVIDSPPAGLVSDPFILGKYSDIVLFVIRQQNTLKKHLDFINETMNDKTLTNVALILNDVKGGSGYGYGYDYGTNNKYGSFNELPKTMEVTASHNK